MAAKKAPKKKAARTPRRKRAVNIALPKGTALAAALQVKFAKTFGSRITTIAAEQHALAQIKEFIPTGIDALDNYVISRGGWPVGRMSEIFGEESCIAGDSIVKFAAVNKETGKMVNSKGGSIKLLYDRFHDIRNTVGRQRAARSSLKFLAPSVDDLGRIVANEVLDVVKTGRKPVFKVSCGKQSLIATADHEFLTKFGYARLEDLAPGDEVLLHLNTPYTVETIHLYARKEASFKAHPYGDRHVVGGCTYYRVRRARAVFEANLNKMPYAEFAGRLNAGKTKGLKFLPPAIHVHHKDEDYTNDRIENLIAVNGAEHTQQHALQNHNDLRFVVQPHVISKIVPQGKADTYDLKMADPYRNYVANGFAVHNCGKTALLYRSLGAAQQIGGVAVLLDAEHSFDEERATTHGIDVNDLVIAQPHHLEEALDMLKSVLAAHDRRKGPMFLGLDSIASLNTKAGLSLDAGEKAVAAEARIFSDELRDMPYLLNKGRAHLCMVNQIRHKIGGSRFASNITTPGGNGPRFYSSVRLQFFGGKGIKNAVDEHIGKIVTVMAVKNRLASPFRKARVRFDYDTGYNNLWTTIEHAKRLKLVKYSKDKPVSYVSALQALDWDFNVVGAIGRERGADDAMEVEADDDDE